jgi:hypothetical protein
VACHRSPFKKLALEAFPISFHAQAPGKKKKQNTLWLFNIAMEKMVYLLKIVIFHGYVK